MYGFYKANGGCGYVKKPDFLMQTCPDGKVFDPKADLPVKATLKVKIYMGEGWHKDFKQTHFDSYSPPDFYVKVCPLPELIPTFESSPRVLIIRKTVAPA